MLHMKLLIT